MSNVDSTALHQAIANTRAHLLSLRNAAGHWEGELSSSALSTATAIVALHTVDAQQHATAIARGAAWLIANQNTDGGWGDTTISKSNLSTTLLCWSSLHLDGAHRVADRSSAINRANHWIANHVGSLEPEAIANGIVARYGKDKTFSVPILMLCCICGTLGEGGWKRVLPLPFEFAAFPRTWFGAIGLPVVSYALPALIAIGYTRFFHAPPARWNPLRWLRASLWPVISPMLKTLQPSSGGYLEATPLTSFVTMALASADEKHHPCVTTAVEFLLRSERADGSWPIDTNLATWGTTLSVKALFEVSNPTITSLEEFHAEQAEVDVLRAELQPARDWLFAQQYREVHPFTNAAPGGWAWTDLPGGVPDADDTSGALIALWHLCGSERSQPRVLRPVEAGITWLLDLQNRDGGMPTFCRGWGTLPFDRSTPEITAHALRAWSMWAHYLRGELREKVLNGLQRALNYLQREADRRRQKEQRAAVEWVPLWFGNEHAPNEENPVHGTSLVLLGLLYGSAYSQNLGALIDGAVQTLLECQHEDGSWGGAANSPPSIEETANAVHSLATWLVEGEPENSSHAERARKSVAMGTSWLIDRTRTGTRFPAAPIGLYFARLWYHERLYPIIWTLGALQQAAALSSMPSETPTA